jgi:hypothetical protein
MDMTYKTYARRTHSQKRESVPGSQAGPPVRAARSRRKLAVSRCSKASDWYSARPADLPSLAVRSMRDARLPRLAAEVRGRARSVVSELVATAIREGRPPIELPVQESDGRVRVEVADGGAGRRRRPPETWAQWIVARLAARWGVRGDDAHIWSELHFATSHTCVAIRARGARYSGSGSRRMARLVVSARTSAPAESRRTGPSRRRARASRGAVGPPAPRH